MSGPLDDVVVIDLTRALAGPHCGMMLADMGARVIKVESPGHGDESRGWGPPFVGPDDQPVSTYFLSCNRNKESVALDLKSDDGRDDADPPGRPRRRAARELPPRRARPAGLPHRAAARAQPRPGRPVDQRVRPRRPRGRARRLRPDRPGRGRADVAHRHRPRAPPTGRGADRRPPRRHVRGVRRGVGAARAQPHRQGPGRAHLAARLDRRGARLPGHPVHRGRRGRARRRQPPPVDLPLRPVHVCRRHDPALVRQRGAVAEAGRGLRPGRLRPRLRHQPRAGRQPRRRHRAARRDLRRHPARRADGAARRDRHPGR